MVIRRSRVKSGEEITELFLSRTRLVHWQQLFVHYRLRLGTLYEELITVERNCGVSEPVNIDAPLCGCVCR
jgi:hypothetical protein